MSASWALLSRLGRSLAKQRHRPRSYIDSCGTRGSSLILSVVQTMTQRRRSKECIAKALATDSGSACRVKLSAMLASGSWLRLRSCVAAFVAAWTSHLGDGEAEQRAATSIGETLVF